MLGNPPWSWEGTKAGGRPGELGQGDTPGYEVRQRDAPVAMTDCPCGLHLPGLNATPCHVPRFPNPRRGLYGQSDGTRLQTRETLSAPKVASGASAPRLFQEAASVIAKGADQADGATKGFRPIVTFMTRRRAGTARPRGKARDNKGRCLSCPTRRLARKGCGRAAVLSCTRCPGLRGVALRLAVVHRRHGAQGRRAGRGRGNPPGTAAMPYRSGVGVRKMRVLAKTSSSRFRRSWT